MYYSEIMLTFFVPPRFVHEIFCTGLKGHAFPIVVVGQINVSSSRTSEKHSDLDSLYSLYRTP